MINMLPYLILTYQVSQGDDQHQQSYFKSHQKPKFR